MLRTPVFGVPVAALAVILTVACDRGGSSESGSNEYPLAKRPGEQSLQAKLPNQPIATHKKSPQGNYEVLPVKAVRLRFSAPWPADVEVSLDNVVLPKETGPFTPTCVAPACGGYYKFGNIDFSDPTPLWDIVVLIPDNKTGPAVTIDVRSVSMRPGATGEDQKSLPLTFTLVPTPITFTPPPPDTTATVEYAIRFPGGPQSSCEQNLAWDWAPNGTMGSPGVSSVFRIPDGMQFTEFQGTPMQIRDDPNDTPSTFCVFTGDITNLATGPWKITVRTPDRQVASCEVTLQVGLNMLGFAKEKEFCVRSDWPTMAYPH